MREIWVLQPIESASLKPNSSITAPPAINELDVRYSIKLATMKSCDGYFDLQPNKVETPKHAALRASDRFAIAEVVIEFDVPEAGEN